MSVLVRFLRSISLIALIHLFSDSIVDSYRIPMLHTKSEGTKDVAVIAGTLHRSLVYIRRQGEARTMDVALGVVLAKGNLRWMQDRCKAASLLGLVFRNIAAEDLKYDTLRENTSLLQLPDFKNCSVMYSYAMKGTPNHSDSCILELLDKSCNSSSFCRFQETAISENSGYKTTHRLLYLELATKLGCDANNPERWRRMKKRLCQRILKEAVVLDAKTGFFARDLFLEQIALCGFNGYTEFAKKQWSRKIPTWQNDIGCFGYFHNESFPEKFCTGQLRERIRVKRDDKLLDGVCHTHLTAVAIAAMAFHLRVALCQL